MGDALAAFQNFVSGNLGIGVPGTQADRDFWAGFSEAASGWGGLLARDINEGVGVYVDSRDYKGGFFVGAIVLAGYKITANLIRSIRFSGLMDSSKIRFSQNDIGSTFKDGRSIEELAQGLRAGTIKPGDVEPIGLVVKDGHLFTLDNRRLWAFQQAGMDVPCRMATPQEAAKAVSRNKFSTRNGGTSVRVG